MFKLSKKQESKRQEVLKMLDISLKLMQDKELTIEEVQYSEQYFTKMNDELINTHKTL